MNHQELILKSFAQLHAQQMSILMSKAVFSQVDPQTATCSYQKKSVAEYVKRHIVLTKDAPYLNLLTKVIVQWKNGELFIHKDKNPVKFDPGAIAPVTAFAIALFPHISYMAFLTTFPIMQRFIAATDFSKALPPIPYACSLQARLTKTLGNEDCLAHRCQTMFNHIGQELLYQLAVIKIWDQIESLPWKLPRTQLIFSSGHVIAQLNESECHIGMIANDEKPIWDEVKHTLISSTDDLIKIMLQIRMVSLSELTTQVLLKIPPDWPTMKFTDFKERYCQYWKRGE